MSKTLLKLSVFCLLLIFNNNVKADSFFLPLSASSCIQKQNNLEDSDVYLKAYDNVAYLAVKTSKYINKKTKIIDNYDFSILAYKIIDKALHDIVTTTTKDDNNEICLNFDAILDIQKADEILNSYDNKKIKNEEIKEISKSITESMPKSIYEAKDSIPLIYIKDLEYYNKKTTNVYTYNISEELSFEPRILITENKELADYYILPKLVKSAVDTIDDKNSRYSMSLVLEVSNLKDEIIIREEKKRYIIISNNDDIQEIAHKMINKLIKEASSSIKEKISILLKEWNFISQV